ncbi:MAG: DUF2213 domain-containing protein [Spirochaetes bacterium]|nr:DUF2213 domain-containing protein [Spirochaetota bacterium]
MKKKTAYRFDTGTIESLSGQDGFLRARVAIARDGVFPYLNPDGTIRMEAKLPDEIFSDITIDTAKGVPVTDGHPPLSDNNGLITTENYGKYVRGSLGDSVDERQGMLVGTETIFDAGLINELKAGRKREVSIGFQTDIDPTPGEYRGKRYDAVQRNIRINHIAHVDKGRAGEDVRAYLDEGIPQGIEIAVQQENTVRSDTMDLKNKQTRHDEKTFLEGMKNFFAMFALKTRKDADELAAAQEQLAQAADEVKNAAAPASPEEAGAMAPIIAALRAQIEALTQLLEEKTRMLNEAMAPAVQDAAIAARLGIVEAARSVMSDFKHDGLTNRDIKLKVIEKALPFKAEVKIDKLEDVRVDAQYEAAMSLLREKAALRTDEPSAGNRLDEAAIEKKRQGRLTLCG